METDLVTMVVAEEAASTLVRGQPVEPTFPAGNPVIRKDSCEFLKFLRSEANIFGWMDLGDLEYCFSGQAAYTWTIQHTTFIGIGKWFCVAAAIRLLNSCLLRFIL